MIYLKLQKMASIGYAYFNDSSVIIVNLDKKFVKANNKELKKKFKSEKISIFKRAEATDIYWEEYGKEFINKSIKEISAFHPEVKEIQYKDITKFKFTPMRRNVKMGGGDTESRDYLGEIMVKTDDFKFWCNHKLEKQDEKFSAIIDLADNKGFA